MHFIVNKSEEYRSSQDALLTDAKMISNSLMLTGYPNSWNIDTVERIGLTDLNSRFNRTKILEFTKIPYSESKKMFDVTHEFLVYFENERGVAVPVFGVCSFGHPDVNLSKIRQIGYYYGDSDANLHGVLDAFNYDVYCDSGCGGATMGPFRNAIVGDLFDFIIIKDTDVGATVAPETITAIEDEFALGKHVLLIDEFSKIGTTPNGFFGAVSDTEVVVSNSDHQILKEMPYLDYAIRTSITVNSDYRIAEAVNADGLNLQNYAEVKGDITFRSWNWTNGTIHHMPSFDITGPAEFYEDMEEAIFDLSNPDCKQMDLDNIEYENIVRLSRFLIKKNQAVNMVILVWD